MKNITLTILILLLTACAKYDQKIIIQNVLESQTIILKNKNKTDNVHAINISVTGHIKGDGQLILMLNEKPYKTEKIAGNVSLKWSGDWYSDKATIIYKAINVTEGNIVIEYNFETI